MRRTAEPDSAERLPAGTDSVSSGWHNKLVGQIGEFLFCAEASRRLNCIATPFSGNVPVFDVLVTNEHLQTTPVQVRTASGKNWQFNAENFIKIELDASNQSQTATGLVPSKDISAER